MTAALLAVHVLAAVVFVGPVTVAASTFPRYVRAAAAGGGPAVAATASAAAMHRICRTYAVLAVSVPVFGLATAAALDVLTQSWVVTSMGLTLVAGLLLGVAVVPQQRRVLRGLVDGAGSGAAVGRAVRRLAGLTGAFNLVWAVVVVLMILRPGSTTGV